MKYSVCIVKKKMNKLEVKCEKGKVGKCKLHKYTENAEICHTENYKKCILYVSPRIK